MNDLIAVWINVIKKRNYKYKYKWEIRKGEKENKHDSWSRKQRESQFSVCDY